MRGGFSPGVLFSHLSFAGKEAGLCRALSPEKSFAPMQHVDSPAKSQGEGSAMPNRPCRFLSEQSDLSTFSPSLMFLPSVHLKGEICSIGKQFFIIAVAGSPASAESRACQRSQSTTFASNTHWDVISCGSQQKMSYKGFNPSSSFPKAAVKAEAVGEMVSASRLLITVCLQSGKPELKNLGNPNLSISRPDSVLFCP